MAYVILATVTLEHVTGLSENRVVNTFVANRFADTLPTEAQLGDFGDDLEAFYNTDNTTDPVARYLSAELSRASGDAHVRFYDIDAHLDGSPHGSPIFEQTFTLGASSGSGGYPGEVAAVMTTRATGWQAALVETPDNADADLVAQRPRQRLSGRIYLGPVNSGTSDASSGVNRLSAGFMTDVLDAGERLWNDLAGHGWSWAVWSRKDASSIAITHLQIDNAYDTMRKRGPDPTVRTTRGPFVP